jgi:tRNA modification GTPase
VEGKEVLVVINKKDLEEPGKKIKVPTQWKKCKHVRVSALTGVGLEGLEQMISTFVTGDRRDPAKIDFAPNLRQKILIQKSLRAAEAAIESRKRGDPGELTALDMDECLTGLDAILGNHIQEDILGRIFDEFCIGK